jgi:hypothetical protein
MFFQLNLVRGAKPSVVILYRVVLALEMLFGIISSPKQTSQLIERPAWQPSKKEKLDYTEGNASHR